MSDEAMITHCVYAMWYLDPRDMEVFEYLRDGEHHIPLDTLFGKAISITAKVTSGEELTEAEQRIWAHAVSERLST